MVHPTFLKVLLLFPSVCIALQSSSVPVEWQNAQPGQWPWQASIGPPGFHTCSGTLISDRWVVSAAHCFPKPINATMYVVRLGVHQLSNLTSPDVLIMRVSQVVVNDRYTDVQTSGGDIALLQLRSRVAISRFVQPACLATAAAQFKTGMNCSVTGWGSIQDIANSPPPQTLQQVYMPLIDSATCNAMLQSFLRQSPRFKPIQDDMICAGYAIGQKSFCQGDSGGPLVCSFNSTWILTGIVSWELTKCAAPHAPGVHTLITSYLSWIKEYAPNLGCNSGSASVKTSSMPVSTASLGTKTTLNFTGTLTTKSNSTTTSITVSASGPPFISPTAIPTNVTKITASVGSYLNSTYSSPPKLNTKNTANSPTSPPLWVSATVTNLATTATSSTTAMDLTKSFSNTVTTGYSKYNSTSMLSFNNTTSPRGITVPAVIGNTAPSNSTAVISKTSISNLTSTTVSATATTRMSMDPSYSVTVPNNSNSPTPSNVSTTPHAIISTSKTLTVLTSHVDTNSSMSTTMFSHETRTSSHSTSSPPIFMSTIKAINYSVPAPTPNYTTTATSRYLSIDSYPATVKPNNVSTTSSLLAAIHPTPPHNSTAEASTKSASTGTLQLTTTATSRSATILHSNLTTSHGSSNTTAPKPKTEDTTSAIRASVSKSSSVNTSYSSGIEWHNNLAQG